MTSTPQAPEIETKLSRQDGQERLIALAHRLQLKPGAVVVRPMPGSRAGMSLTLDLVGGRLTKACDSQPTKDKNFICLVLWLGDLVRNIERGIETFEEAFYNEGARGLSLRNGQYDGLRLNEYQGEATREDSYIRIERSLERLGLVREDSKVMCDAKANFAELKLRLASGRVVAKSSQRQRDVDRNLHVLALWLQTKAKNFERGLEPDLNTLFAANLLPA